MLETVPTLAAMIKLKCESILDTVLRLVRVFVESNFKKDPLLIVSTSSLDSVIIYKLFACLISCSGKSVSFLLFQPFKHLDVVVILDR